MSDHRHNNIAMKKLFAMLGLCCLTAAAFAQSIWDRSHLEQVKQSLTLPTYALAYRALIDEADEKLSATPLSVMMKEKTPASGNKHDYMSQARYFWPDPSKPDGLPYITRDGESNPELEKLDRVRLGRMADNVTAWSLAYYFSNDEKYARKATEQLRVWFLDKKTRMNPHLTYAQVVPGENGDRGRCYGVIDTYSFVEMLDAVQLLESSKSFTAKDSKALKAWFGALLDWLLTSDMGQEESRVGNNHSVAYDVQAVSFALYAGNKQVAEQCIREFPGKRIYVQIEPDGSQPAELGRTLAFGYSEFNLHHMIDMFVMGSKIGLSIDDSTSTDGRNFYKAVDFLTPYAGKEVTAWPYQQISEWDYKQQEFCKDLYRAYLLNPTRTDYLELYRKNSRVELTDRFYLIYI